MFVIITRLGFYNIKKALKYRSHKYVSYSVSLTKCRFYEHWTTAVIILSEGFDYGCPWYILGKNRSGIPLPSIGYVSGLHC